MQNIDDRVLKLINFNNFISEHKCKEVKNNNIFGITKRSFDEEGLWSPSIFGQIGSKERKEKFAYIDLAGYFINPILYKMIMTTSESVRDIISEKKTFVLEDGKFIENEYGETGLLFLLENKDNFDFINNCKKNKTAEAIYLDKNKNIVYVNIYLICPPGGIRDMSTSQKSTKQFSSEINDYYIKLISLVNQYKINISLPMISIVFIKEIQKTLITCYIWFRTKLQGKSGLTRGTLMKKTIDYSGRIIAGSDPNIPLGYIGLPFHTVLILYEPFFFHYVMKSEDEELKKSILDYMKERNLDYKVLKKFNLLVSKNPEIIPDELKQRLIFIATEITKDKDCLLKRDPVVSRVSYYSATPMVLSSGRGAIVNVLTCPRQTLDFDGDQLAILPVFANESLKEAQKLNPRKDKNAWLNPIDNSSHTFKFELDIISTIFAATKVV